MPLCLLAGMGAERRDGMIKIGHIVQTKDSGARKYAGIHILFQDGSFGYRDSDGLDVIGWADIRRIFSQIENAGEGNKPCRDKTGEVTA